MEQVTFPSRIPFEDDKFKWDYDDKGVICRYSKEEQGWEVMEPYCVECGHRTDECECEDFYGRQEEVSDSDSEDSDSDSEDEDEVPVFPGVVVAQTHGQQETDVDGRVWTFNLPEDKWE
jgi:hypothetical protein